MKSSTIVIVVIAVILLILLPWGCNSYNSLVQSDETVHTQLGQLNNVYQQRADLIPNLVEVVKGYAAHESKVFIDVADARARAAWWQREYNRVRPHSGLGYQTPQMFSRECDRGQHGQRSKTAVFTDQ